MIKQPILITINNQFQNLGASGFPQANAKGNLPMQDVTVQDVNSLIGRADVSLVDAQGQESSELPFGEHIREAVKAVRKILK